MLVLSFVDFEPAEQEQLRELYKEHRFVWYKDPQYSQEMLKDAEVILGNPPPDQLRQAEHLKWLQTMTAGVDVYLPQGVLHEEVVLSNCSGSFGLAIAELMLVSLGMLLKKMHVYQRNQLQGRWVNEGRMQSYEGLRVLIVGLGNLGDTFARKLHGLGALVSGVKRDLSHREDHIQALYTMEQLPEVIGQFDVVASFLPKTAQTHHLFDLTMISRMKPSAYLVNAGRGDVIETQALVQAIEQQKIAGAALDVLEFEPLPQDHVLWTYPNVIITPHVAGWFNLRQTYDGVFETIMENSRRYLSGEPLRNIYDRSANRTVR